MKKIPILSWVFTGLGVVLASAVLVICLSQRNGTPLLLGSTQGAEDCARNLMERVCAGDYAGASQYLYGNPELGSAPQGENAAAELIWQAFLSSLSFQPAGDCRVDEKGLTQDYILSGLDIPALLAKLKQTAPGVLNARVNGAESFLEVYDDSWQYREEFTQSVLEEAARQVIGEATPTQQTIRLRLAFADGRWWVMPDAQLLTAISGGIL